MFVILMIPKNNLKKKNVDNIDRKIVTVYTCVELR